MQMPRTDLVFLTLNVETDGAFEPSLTQLAHLLCRVILCSGIKAHTDQTMGGRAYVYMYRDCTAAGSLHPAWKCPFIAFHQRWAHLYVMEWKT